MISTSADYQKGIVADSRWVIPFTVIDIISPDIVFGVANSSGEAVEISRADQLTDKKLTLAPYATLEPNRWILDGSQEVFPVNKASIKAQVGFIGSTISDRNGNFTPAVWVEQTFTNVSVLQGFSIYFSGADIDGLAVDFTLQVRQGDSVYFQKEFKDNTEQRVIVSDFTVYNPTGVRIIVTKWSKPFRRVRLADIIPGIYEEWGGDIIESLEVKHQGDPSCLTLPYGSCKITMDNSSRRFDPGAKAGVFQSIEERQALPVSLGLKMRGKETEYIPVGTFYQAADGWKTGNNNILMQWNLIDIIGLVANREYIPPAELPTTLDGWVASIVEQLGKNFAKRYKVADDIKGFSLVTTKEKVIGQSCGNILLWVCQKAGVWPRASAVDGNLLVEPLKEAGKTITLDNLEEYPTISANKDIAAIIFTLPDGSQIPVGGNVTNSSETKQISNPFIANQAEALEVARRILATAGGNKYELNGRGDMSSEIGDIDTVTLNKSNAATGRRIEQTFNFKDGILRGCKSTLIQASGSLAYENRIAYISSASWHVPDGITEARIILIGKGADGLKGTDGTFNNDGANGADGRGGLVYSATVQVQPGQDIPITIGDNTQFGAYSSASGQFFSGGYMDISTGDIYARTGVNSPKAGSGDGGRGGYGGPQGYTYTYKTKSGRERSKTVQPGKGGAGVAGATGVCVIYYARGAE